VTKLIFLMPPGYRAYPDPTSCPGVTKPLLDVELADLPLAARWREWMLRVEAAIFASAKSVPREAPVRLVGQDRRFDDLIADLTHELRGRPYDLVQVASGYALRTKTRFAPGIRAAHPGRGGDEVADLTRTETLRSPPSLICSRSREGRFPSWRDGRSVAT
jgi:hypothetical protein